MEKVSYYTAEGMKKLRDELNQLKDVERPRASQAIAEARDKGDLSENAEYDAAKEAQGLLEMKIAKLEKLVANARIIDESQLDVSKVLVLSTVKLKNLANNMQLTYTLVAESEADLKAGKISVSSPIGKGLLGKSVGEIAEIKVPNGTLKMEVRTNHPVLHIYAGYYLPELHPAHRKTLGQNKGICFEAQGYADATKHPQFNNVVLLPNEVYEFFTEFKFQVIDKK